MTTPSPNGRFVSAALLLGAASLGSRLMGLVRDRALTTTFGAGDVVDAFVAAFRLPDLIFNLVVVGALSASFIPLFTEKLMGHGGGRRAANDFAVTVFNAVVLVVAGCSLLYAAFAPWLVPLLTPGFNGEKLAMTITLSRIMAMQPVLLAASFVFSGILNSHKRFIAYAAAPILYNIGIIAGVLLFVPAIGISGLAWGVVVGALLHTLVQLPGTLQLGWRWRPAMHWASADARKLRRMIIPRIFGLAGQQVNLFVVTILGSTLAAGSITVFHLANNVQSLPIGVFGLAFAQAAFPTLAEHAARRHHTEFRNTLTQAFRYILFFVIPTAALFFLLRAQIIRILFGDGAFDWEDTILTFRTFGWLITSLFAQATIPLLVRAFYVRQNTRTPVVISLVSIVTNIGLAVTLAARCGLHLPLLELAIPCGVEGLAFAFSVAAIVNLVLLLGTLHWQLDGLNDRKVLFSLARITVASLIASAVAQLLKYPIAALVNMHTFWGVFTQLVVAGGGGLATYIGVCLLLGCEELAAIRKFLPRRLTFSPGTDTTRFGGLLE